MTTTEQAKQVVQHLRKYSLVAPQTADLFDALVAENEKLREAMRKLLTNADWRVGRALTHGQKAALTAMNGVILKP